MTRKQKRTKQCGCKIREEGIREEKRRKDIRLLPSFSNLDSFSAFDSSTGPDFPELLPAGFVSAFAFALALALAFALSVFGGESSVVEGGGGSSSAFPMMSGKSGGGPEGTVMVVII